MSKRPVTIKQIAEASGVSRATVSAVLHGKDWVSTDTRAKVQRVLREKQYQHTLVANSLSEHFSRVVGVVLGNIHNPFNTELLAGLQNSLEQSGYFVFQHTTDESYESELNALNALKTYHLGGYVIAPVQEGNPHDHLRRLVDSGRLLVTIGAVPDVETHVVDFDDQAGARQATKYLLDHGHRVIGCLAGAETSLFARHRILGYVESLMEQHVQVEDSLVVHAGDTLTSGYEAAKKLLAHHQPRPTALFCFNDLIAMAAYRAAYDLGLSIPEDLSVIGFDDCALAAIMGPPLTTVATYPEQLGRHVADIILTVHRDKNRRGFLHKRTHPRLIERLSVASI